MNISASSNYLRNKLVDLKLKNEIVQLEIEKFVRENINFKDIGFTSNHLDWKAKLIRERYESFAKGE